MVASIFATTTKLNAMRSVNCKENRKGGNTFSCYLCSILRPRVLYISPSYWYLLLLLIWQSGDCVSVAAGRLYSEIDHLNIFFLCILVPFAQYQTHASVFSSSRNCNILRVLNQMAAAAAPNRLYMYTQRRSLFPFPSKCKLLFPLFFFCYCVCCWRLFEKVKCWGCGAKKEIFIPRKVTSSNP